MEVDGLPRFVLAPEKSSASMSTSNQNKKPKQNTNTTSKLASTVAPNTPGPRPGSRRAPISPKRSIKSKRASPKPVTTPGRDSKLAKPISTKTPRLPITSKPLVPLGQRKLHDDKTSLEKKRDTDADRWEIITDGTSAGREGRQFTVSNVGNNGRIYLRPTVRLAHQRYPQPDFIFPVTPPGTASLDDPVKNEKPKDEGDSELRYSQWTPTPGTLPPSDNGQRYWPKNGSRNGPMGPSVRHRRALSDSTVQDGALAKENDSRAFKIIISKPGNEKRPKTTEDLNPEALLDVNIPTWRIGVPRFTSTGTPFIYGSSYAPTEISSFVDGSQKDGNMKLPRLGSRRVSTIRVPRSRFSRTSQDQSAPGFPTQLSKRLRLTSISSRLGIEPSMYDALTFKPARDDRSIVRYSPSTGAVTAATPPRLVAEITSESFLDYELISDFFLSFRTFLEPSDLLKLLIARLRWAVSRNDEIGMIVHVRGFVALRHWILNYFMDDFLVDYDLRVNFCTLINEFHQDLSNNGRDRRVQLKVLIELKKCWRRVCAQYWDSQVYDDNVQAQAAITPGGIAGHRDPNLDPSFWDQENSCPQLDSLHPIHGTTGTSSFYADVSRAGHVGDSIIISTRPMTPEPPLAKDSEDENDLGPASPGSLASMHVVSCSFPVPGKQPRNVQPSFGNGNNRLAAHPTTSGSAQSQSGQVAITPKTLVGKRVRASQTHQRNDSLGDSWREANADMVSFKDQDFLMANPYAGSLVRGNILPPPGESFVDVAPQSRNKKGQRQTTICQPQGVGYSNHVNAMSGRGMKKLMGSVRRAFSTRGPGVPPVVAQTTLMSAFDIAGCPNEERYGLAATLQGTATREGGRPPVRIDLLGAEVAENFKKAVREDAAAEAEKRRAAGHPPAPDAIVAEDNVKYPATPVTMGSHHHPHHADHFSQPQTKTRIERPTSDMELTIGSKSIVIVDDTPRLGPPSSGFAATTAENPSVEAFFDSLVPNGGNLTPPITPPTRFGDPARQSSFLFNDHTTSPLTRDALPPFIPDLDTLEGRSSAMPSEARRPPSQGTTYRNYRNPPMSSTPRTHRRNASSRTQQSFVSTIRRRNASFSSDLIPPSMTQSFDATTYTRCSIIDDEPASSPVQRLASPKPMRVLRRRPGGDLRAATSVGELASHVLRRSHSLGSLSAYTESIRSSRFRSARRSSMDRADSLTSVNKQRASQLFSVGQFADKPKHAEPSASGTNASKPPMRPSFEAEAKRLAQIPDDEDDGGVEAALLKLEGRFEKRPSIFTPAEPQIMMDHETNETIEQATSSPHNSRPKSELQRQKKRRNRHFSTRNVTPLSDAWSTLSIPKHTENALEVPSISMEKSVSFLSDDSVPSYSSIPLLDRDLTDDASSRRTPRDWAGMSMLQDSEDDSPRSSLKNLQVSKLRNQRSHSYEFIEETESLKNVKRDTDQPPNHGEISFLDSDLSSELSDEDIQPTPNPHMKKRAPVHSAQDLPIMKPFPASPEAATLAANTPETDPPKVKDAEQSGKGQDGRIRTEHDNMDSWKYSVHLPFILAFDSDTLAQQFTLIEKDALNEIDWKELVDMDWKNSTNHDSRSWVDFLRNTDAQGVEVVIARFNLVVKWAISEIVMTHNIEERAKCIIKYIHIAAHCRRYRNFATLAQLTIALSSSEVSRLARTWELVPPSDMKTLRDLENLVTPTRNFHNLRGEMESGPDSHCIPFVGIYTHDLLYNAQRPSEIASSPTTEPLVNFERCRMGAVVVKTLLRLLEASTRYNFHPIDGITERCLWIGALSDEEIRKRSGNLE